MNSADTMSRGDERMTTDNIMDEHFISTIRQ